MAAERIRHAQAFGSGTGGRSNRVQQPCTTAGGRWPWRGRHRSQHAGSDVCLLAAWFDHRQHTLRRVHCPNLLPAHLYECIVLCRGFDRALRELWGCEALEGASASDTDRAPCDCIALVCCLGARLSHGPRPLCAWELLPACSQELLLPSHVSTTPTAVKQRR